MHKRLLSRGSFARMLSRENPFAEAKLFVEGGGGGTPTAEALLLEKIQAKVKDEIETRKYQNKSEVEALVTAALKDLPLEALRKYEAPDESLNTTVKNIAAELEKVKNIRIGKDASKEDKKLLRRALTAMLTGTPAGENTPAKASPLELLMRNKGQKGEISLNIRAAVEMTTQNTIDENNYPLEMIESMNIIDGVTKIRRGTQYIFDFANVNTFAEIDEYTTWMEEGDEQGGFAEVAEGTVKPLVSGSLVRNFAKARKIAAKKVITEEFAKFRAKAYAIISDLINLKLLRDYAAILTADLQALAAAYVGTTLDGTFATPTDYDAIGAVAAQIETLNFAPDMIIIHPQDKWRLSLAKDSVGQYYFMMPMYDPTGLVRMMGFRVLTSTYQTIGSFTLGEAGLFQIEQETLTVRMGYGIDVTTAVVDGTTVVTAVASDFDTNKFRVIVENYFKDWLATPHIGSFVTASFATVKAALQSA